MGSVISLLPDALLGEFGTFAQFVGPKLALSCSVKPMGISGQYNDMLLPLALKLNVCGDM